MSSHISGRAAEHAREAEVRQRDGDPASAAILLEEALQASMRVRPELPGWVCGRLASIYRTLKRYDDEVDLLERYRESQSSEDARTRFDARLSKARAIADRKRRPDTGALDTVRQVRTRSSLRRRTLTPTPTPTRPVEREVPLTPSFSPDHLFEMRTGIADLTPNGTAMLRAGMAGLCADARTMDTSVESLVSALKTCWIDSRKPDDLTDEEWHERYATSLIDLLAAFFGELE
ncbi:MAG: hypothetical protein ABIP93_07685 [Gemmatimonadaceae bacterium]